MVHLPLPLWFVRVSLKSSPAMPLGCRHRQSNGTEEPREENLGNQLQRRSTDVCPIAWLFINMNLYVKLQGLSSRATHWSFQMSQETYVGCSLVLHSMVLRGMSRGKSGWMYTVSCNPDSAAQLICICVLTGNKS